MSPDNEGNSNDRSNYLDETESPKKYVEPREDATEENPDEDSPPKNQIRAKTGLAQQHSNTLVSLEGQEFGGENSQSGSP